MAIIAGRLLYKSMLLVAASMLYGCGLTQTVTEGTLAITRSIFYKQVNTLHLDIRARGAINTNESGVPLATIVRIYQLKDANKFAGANYLSLFTEDSQIIKPYLLAEKDIRIRPGEAITVDMPMEKAAEYVAVAALFIAPDNISNSWRVIIKREDLDADSPRQIELNNHSLTLLPLKDK